MFITATSINIGKLHNNHKRWLLGLAQIVEQLCGIRKVVSLAIVVVTVSVDIQPYYEEMYLIKNVEDIPMGDS